MSGNQAVGTEHWQVGVVVERRRLNNPWIDHSWHAVQVLPGVPAAPPWTKLAEGDGWERYYAGPGDLQLFRRETISYKYNLESSQPSVFIVLRRCSDERGIMLHLATVCAGEAHAYAESMEDVVEAVPMPEEIRAWVADYVARHHVDEKFYKRKRNRADTEALARRSFLYESDPLRQMPEDE
ncbi:MAG TPA: DUF3305 domain-containing protein [Ferrovibrio sp.]|jgi:hypothetical protein|uniref:DUF3305 domain-containing protein n=1 Tax=Ferrovibrio sp. TaxID=1917215 RepID=UPI002B4B10C4|nr:DUF3305 domain-containing protein [Ferrovibrio sp.]HLT78633.1 DUF3305 domain-containing protein [Ferrovibrio sp.]